MKPTIRITTQKDVNSNQSFFGGLPKLPINFEWPMWDTTSYYLDKIKYAEKNYREYGTEYWRMEIEKNQKKLQVSFVPLTFLGQIYLEEVPRYGDFPNLPSSGTLCFFWDVLLNPPGSRASSRGSCRVVYINDVSELQTRAFPTEMVEKFSNELDIRLGDFQCGLSFEPSWVSSNYLDSTLEADDDDEDSILASFLRESIDHIPNGFPERDEATILVKDHSSAGAPMHLLFGSPMEIQNPMEEMCQLCFHGFDEDSNADVTFLKEGVKDWQLLLQLDSDDNLDWLWGDAGMLYFWIRKQDLEKQDFSNVWCEMQCT